MNDKINVYVPFTKVNEEERIVEGYASTEMLDSQGEIVTKQAMEEATPDYMKFANVREMHQPKAAGKTLMTKFDEKGTYVRVKVVADDAWKLVKEGVYNGFSIGGRKLMQLGNKVTKLMWTELSIVDRPANPGALFTVVKFDNSNSEIQTMTPQELVKTMTEAVDELTGGQMTKSISAAAHFANIANELNYMVQMMKEKGKKTSKVEGAIKDLKAAVQQELASEE